MPGVDYEKRNGPSSFPSKKATQSKMYINKLGLKYTVKTMSQLFLGCMLRTQAACFEDIEVMVNCYPLLCLQEDDDRAVAELKKEAEDARKAAGTKQCLLNYACLEINKFLIIPLKINAFENKYMCQAYLFSHRLKLNKHI